MLLRLILLFLLSPVAAASAREAPRRVVSQNLCADQLLIELADPGQVVSLSPLAVDRELSFFAERAGAFPANRGSAEDIVRLDADLVLTGPFDNRYTRALLEARGMRFLVLDPWRDFLDGAAQIRGLAGELGHPERGEALISRIGAALAEADALGAEQLGAEHPQRATSLVLHRRGFVFRSGLTNDIVRRAGLVDASEQSGVGASGFVSLETLLMARPDYLIVSQGDFSAMDQGQALLAHPALRAAWPRDKRLVLPDRLTICSGPSTPALIERIVAEIRAKVR